MTGKPINWRLMLFAVAFVASQALVALSAIALLGANTETATSSLDLARAIQQEREYTIRSNCEDQNARHDKTLNTLDALVASGERTAKERAGTEALIKAVVPKRDCVRVVRAAVRRR